LNGATAADLTAQEQTGWAELNAALAAGKPVVAYGDCYPSWKKQFAETVARSRNSSRSWAGRGTASTSSTTR
jgi:hypothetical protein